jgi:hypothetical protein
MNWQEFVRGLWLLCLRGLRMLLQVFTQEALDTLDEVIEHYAQMSPLTTVDVSLVS